MRCRIPAHQASAITCSAKARRQPVTHVPLQRQGHRQFFPEIPRPSPSTADVRALDSRPPRVGARRECGTGRVDHSPPGSHNAPQRAPVSGVRPRHQANRDVFGRPSGSTAGAGRAAETVPDVHPSPGNTCHGDVAAVRARRTLGGSGSRPSIGGGRHAVLVADGSNAPPAPGSCRRDDRSGRGHEQVVKWEPSQRRRALHAGVTAAGIRRRGAAILPEPAVLTGRSIALLRANRSMLPGQKDFRRGLRIVVVLSWQFRSSARPRRKSADRRRLSIAPFRQS
jgi:hypothetical protein